MQFVTPSLPIDVLAPGDRALHGGLGSVDGQEGASRKLQMGMHGFRVAFEEGDHSFVSKRNMKHPGVTALTVCLSPLENRLRYFEVFSDSMQ